MAHSYILNKKNIQNGTQFLNFLQKKLSLIKDASQNGLCYYFDTFDWRLYHRGYYLYLFNNYLYFYQYMKRKVELKQEFSLPNLKNFKSQDGVVLKKVNPIIGVRALMCKATFRLTQRSFKILNKDEKTIAMLEFEQSKIKDVTKYKILPSYIEIQALRGYADQIPEILKEISEANIFSCKENLLERGLKEIGKKPADYSSKISIKLTKSMSAVGATKQIYLHLLSIIEGNVLGIVNDIDIEFLHDFRVAIRRTRSALGQLKGILDDNKVLKAQKDFSYLGKSTNKLRDLDVYLLRENQYKLMLPLELRKYLEPFFRELNEQRKAKHLSLVKLLKTTKYQRIISDWKNYVNSLNVRDKENVISAKNMAQTVIAKRNRKVLKFGRQVIVTGSDDLLHQLRIEGKKLRYLLEFFSSLFKQEKMHYLIEKLKLLQDNLGEYNDLAIQQERLFDAAIEIIPRNRTDKNSVLALGILIGKLNEKQQVNKNQFAKIFSMYADTEVQNVFNELFQIQERHFK
jgi:CHAD domain-containing protein